MNGLKYIMFVKELPLKEVSLELKISVSAINDWVNGRKSIPQERKEQLSKILGVSEYYLDKEIDLKDKLEIELQISTLNRKKLKLEEKVIEVINQNSTVVTRYKELLNGVNQQTNLLYSLKKDIEELNKKIIELNKIDSLVNDPKGYGNVLEILQTVQKIRMKTIEI